MEIVPITVETPALLHEFLKNPMSMHFRYFERRTPDSLRNHITTLIGTVSGTPVAYGHIDFEGKYWIGLCVLEAHHRKGYGTQILTALIERARAHPLIDVLHLTVDRDNIGAQKLYERAGFRIEDDTASAAGPLRMSLTLKPVITLPVSYGEAVDKLTILDIKMEMLTGGRRTDVEKEYNAIQKEIAPLLTDTIQYYYSILKEINKSIWVMQDRFRESNNTAEKNELCSAIIVENDRRFRVKSKINNYFQSSLKEQKGYIPRKAFVLTHLGLGDMITANGMVRYLSTQYERVVVVCKNNSLKNVSALYADDPTIEIYPVASDSVISPRYGAPVALLNRIKETYDLYCTGFHVQGRSPVIKDLPFSFYDDVKMDYSVFWKYFHAPTTSTSKELLNNITSRGISDFVFIHNTSSTGEVFSVDAALSRFRIDPNSTLIINTAKNIYPSTHPFYEIAQPFVMALIIDYKSVIENASKIFVSDSSLFCFAMNLTPKRTDTEGYLVSRGTFGYDHIYTAKYSPPASQKRIIFQQLSL